METWVIDIEKYGKHMKHDGKMMDKYGKYGNYGKKKENISKTYETGLLIGKAFLRLTGCGLFGIVGKKHV